MWASYRHPAIAGMRGENGYGGGFILFSSRCPRDARLGGEDWRQQSAAQADEALEFGDALGKQDGSEQAVEAVVLAGAGGEGGDRAGERAAGVADDQVARHHQERARARGAAQPSAVERLAVWLGR